MILRDDTNKENSLYHDALFWLELEEEDYKMTDFVRNINQGRNAALRKAMKYDRTWQHQDNNFDTIPIAYEDLVAGEYRYSILDKHNKIKRLRVKNKEGKYETVKAVDRRLLNDDDLDPSRTGVPAKYDKIGRVIRLTPVPDYGAEDGLEIEYQTGISYFTVDDLAKTSGFDDFYDRLMTLYAVKDYAAAKQLNNRLPIILTGIAEMENDLKDGFVERDMDDSPKMTLAGSDEYYDNLY